MLVEMSYIPYQQKVIVLFAGNKFLWGFVCNILGKGVEFGAVVSDYHM